MYNMQKLPAQSDTNRIPYSRSPYVIPSSGPKNYRSLILKIISVVVVLVILIALAVILIKIFVLDSAKKECSAGFFHPEDEENKSSCYPCKLSNCKNCKGKIRSNTCTECLENYKPEYDSNKEIFKCGVLGPGTNSSSKTEEDNNKCSSGYYLPDDIEEKICQKCSINNCEKCQGNKNNDECTLCKENYIPKYDENNKIKSCNKKCDTNNKCKECDIMNNECLICDKGYFIPSADEQKIECVKCSLEHCQSCEGKKEDNECGLCEDGYEAVYDNNIIKECKLIEEIVDNNNCEIGEGDKCLSCNSYEKNKCASCNPSYKLVEGKCVFDEGIPTHKIEPTEKIEEVKPTEKIQEVEPTQKVEPTPKVEPTQKIEPTPKVEPTQKAEPTQKIEPTQKAEPTQKVEPTQKPTQKIEPTQKVEPTQKPTQKTEPIVTPKNAEDDPDDPTDDFLCLTAEYISPGKNKLTPILYTGKKQYIKQMRVDGELKPSNDIRVENSGNYLFEDESLNLHTIKFWLELKEDILDSLFRSTSYLKSITFNKIKNINTNTVIKTMYDTFRDCGSLEYINFTNFNTERVENMHCLFYKNYKLKSLDLSTFNTKNVKVMSWLFYGCSSLSYLDLSSFDTSQVTEMMSMFCDCYSLTSINFGDNFVTSNVVNMSFMFSNNSLIELDLRHFDTRKVKNMQYMFYKCGNLKSLDITSFDISQVTTIFYMFSYCTSLTSLDLHNFDFNKFTSPAIMFYCKSLKFIDISSYRNLMFRDFFTGIPTSGGTIRASRALVNNLLSMGVKVLLEWDWEIVG